MPSLSLFKSTSLKSAKVTSGKVGGSKVEVASNIEQSRQSFEEFQRKYDPVMASELFTLKDDTFQRKEDGTIVMSAAACASLVGRFMTRQCEVDKQRLAQASANDKTISFRSSYLKKRLDRQQGQEALLKGLAVDTLPPNCFGTLFSEHVRQWNADGGKCSGGQPSMVSYPELLRLLDEVSPVVGRLFEVGVAHTAFAGDEGGGGGSATGGARVMQWVSADEGSDAEEPMRNRMRELVQRRFAQEPALLALLGMGSAAWYAQHQAGDAFDRLGAAFGLDSEHSDAAFGAMGGPRQAAHLHAAWVQGGGPEQVG